MKSPPSFSLVVVGVDYPNRRGPARRFEVEICKPGERIELRPEPKNLADPRAIAVYSCRDIQIGYVRAEQAALIGKRLRENEVQAIFQTSTPSGAIVRLSFDGQIPVLPAARESTQSAPEDDFYPDEIWPDD